MNKDLIAQLRQRIEQSRSARRRSQECRRRAEELAARAERQIAKAELAQQRRTGQIPNSKISRGDGELFR